ncbi:FAD-dependent oxidoreductase [Erythrobacter sp. BLCC-B19]|uniref:FAD-dependent oxidoreductase n=1 Tax=Erythrobacter sp. BLCC-B19 TaxID=3025315 RepID=UPI0023608AC1|nr:FAD-dependent oxidoreductase [Erythrobacter sp. BLCC-B19]WDA41592.1 FAD-dependent oxidoreductase [Erythrobacter sp. BLCC-B19]
MAPRSAENATDTRTLLLVGGGHAHVAVLADWARAGPPPGVRTLLLTPDRHLRYSGMVPGWLAGQHGPREGRVDLAALAARADVTLIADRCAALDPEARVVTTASGARIAFDHASVDTGGIGRAAAVLGDDPRLIDVRPIGAFVDQVAARRAGLARVVVVGGGAAGVELAFALRNLAGAAVRPDVRLVTGTGGLLPGFAASVQRRAAAALVRQGIVQIAGPARFAHGALMAGGQSLEPADAIIAAIGSAAPQWARASGLAVDPDGFIAVDARQQSLSHPHIFAVGDVAARRDRPLAHAGVHAVMTGPVLAANLRSVLTGRAPARAYRPRRHSLYLLNTGDGSAILSYGPLAAQGAWVLALKHRIDKGWIAQYAAVTGTV